MAVAEYPPKGMMEETTACFNSNAVPARVEDVAYSQEDQHHHHHPQNVAASTAEEVDLHHHYQQQELMGFAAEDDSVVDCRNISLVTLEEVICQCSRNGGFESRDHDDHHKLISQQVADPLQFLQTQAPQNFSNNGPSDIFAPALPPDLPNLFNLARCSSSSLLPSLSLSFTKPNSPAPPLPFDPLIHLSNLQPQPSFMRELFQSLPNGGVCSYNNLLLSGLSSFFGGSNNIESGETEGDEGNNLGMTMVYCEEDGGHQFVENNNDVSKFWSDTMAGMDMSWLRKGSLVPPREREGP
ncbi:hypothetical protein NL676_007995 [Syzygium grande]|nr:hypothetical protein NL676_007995 [Syzygium grande]